MIAPQHSYPFVEDKRSSFLSSVPSAKTDTSRKRDPSTETEESFHLSSSSERESESFLPPRRHFSSPKKGVVRVPKSEGNPMSRPNAGSSSKHDVVEAERRRRRTRPRHQHSHENPLLDADFTNHRRDGARSPYPSDPSLPRRTVREIIDEALRVVDDVLDEEEDDQNLDNDEPNNEMHSRPSSSRRPPHRRGGDGSPRGSQ